MPVDKNEWSSYFREKVIIAMNFFFHINNMGVEVILHRGSPHIYIYTCTAGFSSKIFEPKNQMQQKIFTFQ